MAPAISSLHPNRPERLPGRRFRAFRSGIAPGEQRSVQQRIVVMRHERCRIAPDLVAVVCSSKPAAWPSSSSPSARSCSAFETALRADLADGAGEQSLGSSWHRLSRGPRFLFNVRFHLGLQSAEPDVGRRLSWRRRGSSSRSRHPPRRRVPRGGDAPNVRPARQSRGDGSGGLAVEIELQVLG